MDEEFFFPQNVRTSYRLFMLGPTHLKRLTVAPVLAVAAIVALHRVSFFGSVAAGVLLAAIYAGFCCIPLMADEQSLLDVGLEIRRHSRSQGRYRNQKEVSPHGIQPHSVAEAPR